jgi:2-methylisocitrate lyase-like PEP mutase family enzyme
MGFAIVLYANAGLQAALRATAEVFSRLKADGSLANAGDMLASFENRQKSVAKDKWDEIEHKYHMP